MSKIVQVFLLLLAPIMAILLALLGLLTLPTNPLGWFLLLVGMVYAVGVVTVYAIRRKTFWQSKQNGSLTHEERGDFSFWFITLGMLATFFLPPVEYLYLPVVLPRTSLTAMGGAVLVILGIVLFVWARGVLGKSYSGHVSVNTEQTLVQNGPYRLIRHPAYTGYLLMALGTSLGYSSLAGLISVLAVLLPGFIYRIKVEEKLLTDHFGQAYYQYIQETKRMIPWIW